VFKWETFWSFANATLLHPSVTVRLKYFHPHRIKKKLQMKEGDKVALLIELLEGQTIPGPSITM
jgi:hypothetical protein